MTPDVAKHLAEFVHGLANEIEKGYIPFAFNCSCRGAHPSCAQARADVYATAQKDTVDRITAMLRRVAGGL